MAVKKAKIQEEEILNAVEEAVTEETVTEETVDTKPKVYTEEELNEEVVIKLFKDNDRYKDDVDVGCNGVICRIPRGVPFKIKRKFALILEESMAQDAATAEMISGLIYTEGK